MPHMLQCNMWREGGKLTLAELAFASAAYSRHRFGSEHGSRVFEHFYVKAAGRP